MVSTTDFALPALTQNQIYLIIGLTAVFFFKRWLSRRDLPPGPWGIPYIGNLLHIPTSYSWLGYAKMGKKYGDIMYMEALGQPMIVLSKYSDAVELFEKRGPNNSDRPWSIMFHELMGGNWNIGTMPYGDDWKRRRKIVHQYYQRNLTDTYQDCQIEATKTMLHDLIEHPTLFFEHVKKMTGAISMKTVYGYDVKNYHDPMTQVGEEAISLLNESCKGGVWMVDIFPFLRYIPEWVPGAGFQKFATYTNQLCQRMLDVPFDFVKDNLSNGKVTPCLTEKYIKEMEEMDPAPADQEKVIKDAACISYTGGADIASSVLTFIMAMAHYPEVQAKAQAELDAVIGRDRLPNFSDRDDLPYIRGITLESFRWQPVVPGGVAHMSIDEDYYKGYRIPAGTIITPNYWAMCYDTDVYPNPDEFDPERYIPDKNGKEALDPVAIAFGFGRRICPGRFISEDNVWLTVARVLSVFTIEKPLDSQGKPYAPKIHYNAGLVSYPDPFQVRFTPRSEKILQVIDS